MVGPPWGWSGRQMVRLSVDGHKGYNLCRSGKDPVLDWKPRSRTSTESLMHALILRKVLVPFKTHWPIKASSRANQNRRRDLLRPRGGFFPVAARARILCPATGCCGARSGRLCSCGMVSTGSLPTTRRSRGLGSGSRCGGFFLGQGGNRHPYAATCAVSCAPSH